MTTVSYPVVGGNIDHAQWRSLFVGQDGIVNATGSSGLSLTLSSTTNTATVASGQVRVRGFMLVVTTHDVAIAPASGSPVTYSLGVMYDPARESDPAGPLYIDVQPKTSQVIPSGGAYHALWEVTRQPSQVLSLATQFDLRRYVGESLLLPDTFPLTGFGFPLGTQAFRAGELLVRVADGSGTGNLWQNQTRPTWASITLPSSVAAAGTAPAFAKINGMVVFRGAWKRADGSNFFPGGGTTGAYSLGTVPAGYRPGVTVSFAVDHGFESTATGARVVVTAAGVITGQVGPAHNTTTDGTTTAIRADGVTYPAEG